MRKAQVFSDPAPLGRVICDDQLLWLARLDSW